MERIEAAHDRRLDELAGFLQRLVACRTDSQSEGNPDFESETARCFDLIEAKLEALGLEIERWIEPPRYPALAARLPGSGNGRSLAINGHIDVVPVGDDSAWTHPAWGGEIADGKLWGRGACDMKAGVAAGIFAVQALSNAGIERRGDLWLHIVADEEVVGWSTRQVGCAAAEGRCGHRRGANRARNPAGRRRPGAYANRDRRAREPRRQSIQIDPCRWPGRRRRHQCHRKGRAGHGGAATPGARLGDLPLASALATRVQLDHARHDRWADPVAARTVAST